MITSKTNMATNRDYYLQIDSLIQVIESECVCDDFE